MKEEDIRPAKLLKKYLELSARDSISCFEGADRRKIDCIACGSNEIEVSFTKHGFSYAQCTNCGTLFQSPRPGAKAFEFFYKNSISTEYWAKKFFPAVAEARRKQILAPRARSLSNLCERLSLEVSGVVDVGAGHGIFLEEWKKLHPDSSLYAVEPSSTMAEVCRSKGITVFEDMVESVCFDYIDIDLVASFEVFEHVQEPLKFLTSLANLAGQGKHIFISTLCVDGFDIQSLWESSNAISPPHHLNFVSIKGFYKLFDRAGLKIKEISTPGVLDVDIVKNAVASASEEVAVDPFIRNILADEDKSKNFQKFLSDNCLSSHAWVFAEVNN